MTSGEYLSSNTGISYPFKQGQDLPDQLTRLFVDASILSNNYSVFLTQASYLVATGVLTFKVGNMSYSVSVSTGNPFRVVGSEGTSFVIDMEYLDTISDFNFEGEASFEESCVVVPAKRVESIEIYNGENDPRNAVVAGNISFSTGYNALLEAEDGTITIGVSPGAGIGTVPCDETECEDDPNTNGEPLPTDNGNAVITGDDCYEITASGNTIQIHGKCVACCQCQDYIDVVEDLKVIAKRVKNSKQDITEDKTNTYFDFIHKQALKNGYPDLDIQLDIAPDADIASIAGKGKLVRANDYHSFRVTCTITNLSGVPSLIMTPDDTWTGSEIAAIFPHWISKQDKTLADGSKAPLQDCMCRGLFPTVCHGDGYNVGASYTISTKTGRDDSKRGWLAYVRSRGPVVRQLKDDTSGIKYSQPNTNTNGGSSFLDSLKSNADAVKTECTNLAINDLNNGLNPSGMLEYADSMTDYLLKLANFRGSAAWDTTGGGFLAPAGYSFTVSWAYVIPGSILQSLKSIVVTYACYSYAPLIAYNFAYNFAESELKSRKAKDGTVYYNTWKAGKYAPDNTRLFRPHYRWAAYDISNGKLMYRGNDDSKWK